jgi:hypothetical protein
MIHTGVLEAICAGSAKPVPKNSKQMKNIWEDTAHTTYTTDLDYVTLETKSNTAL